MADNDDSKNGNGGHEERIDGAVKRDEGFPLKKKPPAKNSVLDTIPPPDDAPNPEDKNGG